MFANSYHGFQPSASTPVIETTIGKRANRKINEALLQGRTTHNQNLKEFTSQYMENYTTKKGDVPEWLKRRQREANKQQAEALQKAGKLRNQKHHPDSGIGALLQQEGNKLPVTVTDENVVAEAERKGTLPTRKRTSGEGKGTSRNNGEGSEDNDDAVSTGSNFGLSQTRRLPRAHQTGGAPVVSTSNTFQSSYEKNFHGNPMNHARPSKPESKKYPTAQERVRFIGGTHDTTSSQRDLGKRGFNPRSRLGNLHSVEEISSTMELSKGSTKSTYHVPGYTGHVPTDDKNRVKMHDKGEDYKKQGARDQLKMNMLHNIPGYAGYTPQAEVNYRDRPVQPGKQTLNTESYDAKPVEAGITSENGISSKCMQDFFVLEANTSADGMASAQKFFANYRPLEGMVKLK